MWLRARRPLLRFAAALALVATLAPAPLAAASRGGGGKGGAKAGTGTISLVVLDSADGLPHYNGLVTFNVSTPSTDQPWVHLLCYQNGTKVAEGWNGYFDGSLSGRNFGLASPIWTGGAADCRADLTNPQWAVLASTSFHVYP